jgi:HSP20 family molecular chaperone IbpA
MNIEETNMSDSKTTSRAAARDELFMTPPVEVLEDSSGITLYADLPGVPRDKLNVQVEADALTIEGELALSVPEGMEVTHAEVSLPRFRRVFSLSRELDGDQVAAEFTHGVLKLHIPKAAHALPKKISVAVH